MPGGLRRAWELYRLNRDTDAQNAVAEFIGQNGETAEALALIALCDIELGNARRAVKTATAALALDAREPVAWDALARAWQARGRMGKALGVLRAATRRYPEHAYLLRQLAFQLVRSRREKEALVVAERAFALDPDDPRSGSVRAYALFGVGRFAEAEQAARRALAANPELSLAHGVLGWACLARRKNREAIECFRESLRLDPREAWVRYGLMEALSARNAVYATLLAPTLWLERRKGWPRVALVCVYLGVPVALCAVALQVEWMRYIALPIVIIMLLSLIATLFMRWPLQFLLRFDREVGHAVGRDTRIILDNGIVYFASLAVLLFGGIFLPDVIPYALTALACVPWLVHARRWPPGRYRRRARLVAGSLAGLGLATLAALLADWGPGAALIPVSIIVFIYWARRAPVWARTEDLA